MPAEDPFFVIPIIKYLRREGEIWTEVEGPEGLATLEMRAGQDGSLFLAGSVAVTGGCTQPADLNTALYSWNGAAWESVPGTEVQHRHLRDLAVLSASDVWMLVTDTPEPFVDAVPVVRLLHWDGLALQEMATYQGVQVRSFFVGSPRDVWITSPGTRSSAVERRDLHHLAVRSFSGSTR